MAQTYAELQTQIEKLQAEATRLRGEETAAVLAKIRKDIETYGIAPKDLFGKISVKPGKSKAKVSTAAKYGDGSGNTWVGRGPRPQWLRNALAGGKTLEDFVLDSKGMTPESPVPANGKTAASKKVVAKKAGAAKKRARANPDVQPSVD